MDLGIEAGAGFTEEQMESHHDPLLHRELLVLPKRNQGAYIFAGHHRMFHGLILSVRLLLCIRYCSRQQTGMVVASLDCLDSLVFYGRGHVQVDPMKQGGDVPFPDVGYCRFLKILRMFCPILFPPAIGEADEGIKGWNMETSRSLPIGVKAGRLLKPVEHPMSYARSCKDHHHQDYSLFMATEPLPVLATIHLTHHRLSSHGSFSRLRHYAG